MLANEFGLCLSMKFVDYTLKMEGVGVGIG